MSMIIYPWSLIPLTNSAHKHEADDVFDEYTNLVNKHLMMNGKVVSSTHFCNCKKPNYTIKLHIGIEEFRNSN